MEPETAAQEAQSSVSLVIKRRKSQQWQPDPWSWRLADTVRRATEGTWDAGLCKRVRVPAGVGGILLDLEACVSGRGAVIPHMQCQDEVSIFSWDVSLSSFFPLYFCLCHKAWLWPRGGRWLNTGITWQGWWSRLGDYLQRDDRMWPKSGWWHKRLRSQEKNVLFHSDLTHAGSSSVQTVSMWHRHVVWLALTLDCVSTTRP